ncbi:YraN family protein [Nocardioidaceae bacterium SCSIO 66511]|nr:YraN family protein [Nocardioidaceae bacterium SCSIO 66511]
MATYEQRRSLGEYGERLAASHLRAAGMVILDRNYRCKHGEIDIVARDGDTLVVCEVKTRRNLMYGAPIESVTPQKAARLRRLAAHWLADFAMSPPSIRIDVIGVVVPVRGAPRVECVAGVA